MVEATFAQMMWNNAGDEYRAAHPHENPWPDKLLEDPEAALVYDDIAPGEKWMVEKGTSLYVACCDCGLVHRIDIATVGSQYQLELWRDDDETARVRGLEEFNFRQVGASAI